MDILPIAFGFGWQEAIPILLVVLVLFGGRKLPELARAMGSSITQFAHVRVVLSWSAPAHFQP